MKKLLLVFAFFAPLLLSAQITVTVEKNEAPDTVRYETYRNFKFEYCLLYPTDMVNALGERADGSGQDFESKGRRIRLTSYVETNLEGQTIQQKFAAEAGLFEEGRVIEEKILQDNWFTLDGQRKGSYFFQKTILQNGIFKTFVLEFDKCSSGRLQPVIQTLSQAFPFCEGKPQL